jgi:glutamine synthetase adenylyltransferase
MVNKASEIPRLCETCAAKATRASVTLCGKCAQLFRVVYLPDDVRTWEEISRDAHGDNGAEIEELIKGLQVRIFNQQRELSKLNTRVAEERAQMSAVLSRLAVAMMAFTGKQPAGDVVDVATRHIRRYMWLRNGNGYAPEEGYARGGEDLDKLCDNGVREYCGVST